MGSDRHGVCRGLGMVLMLLVQSLVPDAQAQVSAADRETARGLMEQGDDQYEKGQWDKALELYRGAHELMMVPTTGIAVARVLERMKRLVEARDMALQVARIPAQPGEHAVFGDARAEALRMAEQLEPRIPSLQVKLRGAVPAGGVTVEMDGKVLPRAAALLPRKVNPGNVSVTVSGDGILKAMKDVTLTEGEVRDVDVELVAAPGPQGRAVPTDQGTTGTATSPLVYVGFGIGAVGIVAGAATGWMASSKTSDLQDKCENSVCPPSLHGDYDAANRLATISNVSFGVGLVGIGVGVYGLLAGSDVQQDPSQGSEGVRWQAMVGPGMTGFQGRF
jgi:hypothetical protein